MTFLFLAIGFLLLIKGADILVDSAARLARILSVPSFIIGFSVIAFGTSAPELAIGIFSGISGTNLITLGDVIGSCFANIALIIGITALIHPINIGKATYFKDIPTSFGVQILLAVLLLAGGGLSRMDALVFLALFGIFLFTIFKRSKGLQMSIKAGAEDLQASVATEDVISADICEEKKDSLLKLTGLIILSLAAVIGGGTLVVNSSTDIARMLGLSDVLIGITVVAVGTSLPELVTSVVAATRKQTDIAIGNIIGSNIFNILFVLGASAFIHPIPAAKGIGFDIAFMLSATILLFLIPLKIRRISKAGGVILLLMYVVFILYKIATV